ncbi:hypothetical protein Tsubulata_046067 [Turnera subulata]|uniref:Bulb-type lectin domain-containing protein n=1 Tax=Turnera subulata TaxID=218843 RepID=A0A9Q0GDM1_9ROSI|nr:hypothetical protein Tsubulata_046067 [Turnera subulata]
MALFAILLLTLFPSLQSNFAIANITLSSSLTTKENSFWPSDSGDFAFGFRQLNTSNLYLLAIWFNKIPDRTIVWYANGDNPAPEGSKVELTASNLALSDPKGLILWEAKPGTSISHAALLDTGNFVLAGNNSGYLWESFKNPTDTILPTQTMDLGAKLSSRLTETNFSKGRFELDFSNGSLQLNPIAWPSDFQYDPYYTSQTYDVNPSQSGSQLVFNESANIYIVRANGDIAQLPSWGTVNYSAGYYYRATLGFDGLFTEYSHPKNSTSNQGWLSLLSVPPNLCTSFFGNTIGSGACGFNSYCLIQENRRPTCDCPPGYVFLDPNNQFGGCKPTFPQGCGLDDDSTNPEELYDIRPFRGVDWPQSDYEKLAPYNQTQCETACLHDCACAVAIFESNKCWKKRFPLSNGWYQTGGTSTVLFKVRKGVPASGYPGPGGVGTIEKARISDFGLAKLLLSDQTRTQTMIRGTRGYVAPEWFKNVPITAKVDVYSFGVMLLEIICCRRSVAMEEEAEERAILTDWAYDCYVAGRFDLLVDNDEVAMDDKERLQKWVSIAIWCIQEDPSRRPNAKMVMAMMEGFVEVPVLTFRPFSFSSSFEVNT